MTAPTGTPGWGTPCHDYPATPPVCGSRRPGGAVCQRAPGHPDVCQGPGGSPMWADFTRTITGTVPQEVTP